MEDHDQFLEAHGRVVRDAVLARELLTQAVQQGEAIRRIGGDANETLDDHCTGHLCLNLRRCLSHNGRLAAAGCTVHHQWTDLAAANMSINSVENALPAREIPSTVVGECLVRLYLEIECRARCESACFCQDYLAECLLNISAELGEIRGGERADIAFREFFPQVFLERREIRIFLDALSGFAEKSEDMLAVFIGLAQAFENLLVRSRDKVLSELCLG